MAPRGGLSVPAAAPAAAGRPAFTQDEMGAAFDRISALMYEISGVNLTDGKRELVRARIGKRLRATGWSTYEEYADFVESEDGREELARMVDTLTTNKTSFFRELPHFDYLREEILPAFAGNSRPLRIWSAGCSSGEEPYSIGILLHQVLGDLSRRDVRILATDLSRRVLAKARDGIYEEAQMEGITEKVRARYFRSPAGAGGPKRFQVVPEIRELVHLAPLNLIGSWPMKGPFDVIFCRNVMIYFDRATRERLVQRFTHLLPPGGHLLVGHSESLNGLAHDLTYVQPAVYRK